MGADQDRVSFVRRDLFWSAPETDCTLLAGVKDEVVVILKRQQTGLLRHPHYPRRILNGHFA